MPSRPTNTQLFAFLIFCRVTSLTFHLSHSMGHFYVWGPWVFMLFSSNPGLSTLNHIPPHTLTQTLTYTHPLTHAYTHPCSHTCTYTLALRHSHIHSHMHTHSHTHTHACSHLTHIHTHTHSHIITHTHRESFSNCSIHTDLRITLCARLSTTSLLSSCFMHVNHMSPPNSAPKLHEGKPEVYSSSIPPSTAFSKGRDLSEELSKI